MGSDKALLEHAGGRLWQQVAARLSPQVERVLISTSTAQSSLNFAPYDCIQDGQSALGPLGGIASVLTSSHAAPFEWLVVSSCDTPLQPLDWVAHLTSAAAGKQGIYYIQHNGQCHYLQALWHRCYCELLVQFLYNGGRAVRQFYAGCSAQAVNYAPSKGPDPFTNLNSPADIAQLARLTAYDHP
jgi:molybdopterin-guanine dinucleotide biosynthesis protein A